MAPPRDPGRRSSEPASRELGPTERSWPIDADSAAEQRPSGKENQKEDPRPWEGEGVIDLAASYSPTEWPLQYHRRWKA